MLIALLLGIVYNQRPSGTPWVQALMSRPKAARYLTQRNKTAPSQRAPQAVRPTIPNHGAASTQPSSVSTAGAANSTRFVVERTPADFAELNEQLRQIKEVREKARILERAGNRRGALNYLRRAYKEYPAGLIGTLIVQMDLRAGANAQAYKDTLELEQAGTSDGLARLALVAALNGEVAPGERDYFMHAILANVPKEQAPRIEAEYPPDDTPNDIAAIVAGTLGGSECSNDFEAAIFDLKLSLTLHPGNPYVLQGLSYAYGEAGQFGKSLRAAQEALDLAKTPELRRVLEYTCTIELKNIKEQGVVGPGTYVPK